MKPFKAILIFGILLTSVYSCNHKEKKEDSSSKPGNKQDSVTLQQQESMTNPYAQIDISPMDMSYFPDDYPKLKMANAQIAPPFARVIYSRPHLQGRELFRDILKYGERWRLGANEATELHLYQAATINGKKIKPGRYVLNCIPYPDKWAIILNTNIDSWGLKPDSTKDIAQFEVPVIRTNRHLEYFTLVFEKKEGGANLLMAWDNLEARLPIDMP